RPSTERGLGGWRWHFGGEYRHWIDEDHMTYEEREEWRKLAQEEESVVRVDRKLHEEISGERVEHRSWSYYEDEDDYEFHFLSSFNAAILNPIEGSKRKSTVLRTSQPHDTDLEWIGKLATRSEIAHSRVAVINLRIENNDDEEVILRERRYPAEKRKAY